MDKINKILNIVMGKAFEATRAKNRIATFAYPYIMKQEFLKYFFNLINNSNILNFQDKNELTTNISKNIGNWYFVSTKEENYKLFIKKWLGIISERENVILKERMRIEKIKRRKVQNLQLLRRTEQNIRKGRKEWRRIQAIKKRLSLREERIKRREIERVVMKRRIKELKTLKN